MVDQIYYKVQYPLKKAISIIKQVDLENPFGEENKEIKADREKIEEFLEKWENEGEDKIKALIKELRKSE